MLLCTSIIESGLDIPNANTLIVDRGDTFGLAQLYQLRGRVGRGAQRAYAYFFRHRKKPPTPEGQERLEVIAENTQLGSGYSIAMRDLEMRGAGELLGTRQHGMIAAVGFHLYTRMLGQAVRQIRRITGMAGGEDAVSWRSARQRTCRSTSICRWRLASRSNISLTRPCASSCTAGWRICRMRTEVQAMEDEFIDRFGALPEPVANLFFQMRVKLRAEEAGLASVSMEGDQIVLRYPPLPEGMTPPDAQSGPGVRAGAMPTGCQANRCQNWRERCWMRCRLSSKADQPSWSNCRSCRLESQLHQPRSM